MWDGEEPMDVYERKNKGQAHCMLITFMVTNLAPWEQKLTHRRKALVHPWGLNFQGQNTFPKLHL